MAALAGRENRVSYRYPPNGPPQAPAPTAAGGWWDVIGADGSNPLLELPRDGTGLATTAAALRRLEQLLPAFLEERVADAGSGRLLVALDGSLESILTASIAVDAVGSERVTAVISSAQLSDEARARDAEAVAAVLDVAYRRLQLQPLAVAFQKVVGATGEPADDLLAMAGVIARFRAACLRYIASTTDGLVVGTATRTDRLLGTVESGVLDAADLDLLADLYRTEVEALAEYLDVPTNLVADRGGLDLVSGPDVIPPDVDPATVDGILRRSVDLGEDDADVAAALDVPAGLVERVRSSVDGAREGRRRPRTPSMAE